MSCSWLVDSLIYIIEHMIRIGEWGIGEVGDWGNEKIIGFETGIG